MGEIADDAMDGLTCEECGVFLSGDPPGHPRKCRDCDPKHGVPTLDYEENDDEDGAGA